MEIFRDTSGPDRSESPRGHYAIDCAGARLCVYARSLATVLRIEGAVDATNARLVAQVVRRFSRLNPPLIVDLSNLDFLGIAGFRELLDLDWERENDQPSCRIVTGAALCRLTRVFTDHDLPVVDSIPEGLHQLDEAIRARRRFISVLARKLELQRATPVVRKFATDS